MMSPALFPARDDSPVRQAISTSRISPVKPVKSTGALGGFDGILALNKTQRTRRRRRRDGANKPLLRLVLVLLEHSKALVLACSNEFALACSK